MGREGMRQEDEKEKSKSQLACAGVLDRLRTLQLYIPASRQETR
jgi:hypothetical protein